MDILQKFLDLTDYTYIFGEEDQLLDRLPKGLIKDSVGNWYMEIGESETMFCCHLDTMASKKEKVIREVFTTKKGNIGVRTSGDTILGADDKAGVVLLLQLIDNKVPGLYYFFIGEERGSVGSGGIVRKEPERFKKYKRCIAFDRREYGSVITVQRSSICCSDKFADALISQLNKYNWGEHEEFKQDPTGIFTDSASFMSTISECTNLSVGYFAEHTSAEAQDITYLKKLSEAILDVNWEELPAERDYTKNVYYGGNRYNIGITSKKSRRSKKSKGKSNDLTDDELYEIFEEVNELMEDALYMYYDGNFYPGSRMLYRDFNDEDNVVTVIVFDDGSIKIGKDVYKSVYDVEQTLMKYYDYKPKEKSGNKYVSNYKDWSDTKSGNKDWSDTKSGNKDWSDTKSGNKNDDADIPEWNNEEFSDTFNDGDYMQDFLSGVLLVAYSSENKSKDLRIDFEEMKNICYDHGVTVNELVYWLDSRNNDPDQTYGLMYDENTGDFTIDDEE